MTTPTTNPYDALADDCNELVLYIENTEPLYNELGKIARRIQRARKIWTDTGVHYEPTSRRNAARYRVALRNLINTARAAYRTEHGALRWTRDERATMAVFLLSLAEEMSFDMDRYPETFTSF